MPARAARKLSGVLAAGLVLLATVLAGMELYARVPASFAVRPLNVPVGTRNLVILFHGRGGRDEPTLMALEARFRELAAARPGTAVIRYIWAPESDTRFRANVNGRRVGKVLGEQLLQVAGLEVIHLVGHSAGAYPADALCRAYRRGARGGARVVITLLDPIGFAGVLDMGWGAREFGACADYAEAVINTDDAVPGTNRPLRNAWNLDVTPALPADAAVSGHLWPVQFYLNHLTADEVDGGALDHAHRPRGAVATP